MVNISQKAFNQDMDRYLEKIRKQASSGGFKQLNFFKKLVDEEVPQMTNNEVHVEYKQPSFFGKMFAWQRRQKLDEIEDELTEEEQEKFEQMETEIEVIEEEESDLEEMEEELEERRESLVNRFRKKLAFFKPKHGEYVKLDDGLESELEEVPEFDEDVKDILKITHSWLEKLPAKHMKSFKDSDDFEKYKSILTKYGLVKKKGVEVEPIVEEIQKVEVSEAELFDKPKVSNKPGSRRKKS